MSQHIKHYTRCDVCSKDDLFDKVDFCNSEWSEKYNLDICDNCTENGEVWHYRDIEEMKISTPKRYNSQWAFVKFSETQEIEFVKWLPHEDC